jgi:cbb3-type cytochrome oxidase subunit 3
MDISLQSIWTVMAFVFFIGIVFWAWSSQRKNAYNKAARMALDDDTSVKDENLNSKA